MLRDLGQERPLILVIDSEQEVLDSISEVLQAAGFGCCCCATAAEATAAALANPPDLIVCDWNLHGEDGVATCQHIKRQPGLEDAPVMFLSGAQRPDVIRRAHVVDSGAYCLRKPFAPKVLLELIDQSLTIQTGVASS
jgi:DNA-binding response OmpR family regulator